MFSRAGQVYVLLVVAILGAAVVVRSLDPFFVQALRLIAFHGDHPLPGAVLRSFVTELYAATEGGPPDPEIHIGPTVALILAQPTAPG